MLLLTVTASYLAACLTARDCYYNGVCQRNGTCACEPGWGGEQCGRLLLGRSYKCGEGGLCVPGMATWGGGVVRDPSDGSYHMYAAAMSGGCPLSDWLTNSNVLHAISFTPAVPGPYQPLGIALGQITPVTYQVWDSLTQHNPEVARAPDGTYLLYYMGSTAQNASATRCGDAAPLFNCGMQPEQQPVCNQRIGLATSHSPVGPWNRSSAPILGPGPPGAWDDLFTTNPTVHVFQNGSVLLVYKARSNEDAGMYTGVAFAEHWRGPYKRSQPSGPIALPDDCEDASVYYSETMQVFRMILHCNCNYLTLSSPDGKQWLNSTSEVPWCEVTYRDGSTEQMQRRERPHWVVDASGTPVMLTNGVRSNASHGGYSWTMITEILRTPHDTTL